MMEISMQLHFCIALVFFWGSHQGCNGCTRALTRDANCTRALTSPVSCSIFALLSLMPRGYSQGDRES